MSNDQYNTCAICGRMYKRCRSCEENRKTWAAWKQFVDSREHFQIFVTLRSYNVGTSTKEEAAEALSKCDLSNMDSFLPEIKEMIANIMAEEPKNTEKERKKDKEKSSHEE